MQNLVKTISTLEEIQYGKPASTKEIIQEQKALQNQGYPLLPAEYIELLHHYNGILYNNAALYGISPLGDFFLDILKENILINNSDPNKIYLGDNDFDYLAYNQIEHSYQIIDKEDKEVLHTYSDIFSAVKHILKINDDIQQYLY